MALRTEESLNCPCNGIFKCGLHSVPKFIFRMDVNNHKQLMKIIKKMEVK